MTLCINTDIRLLHVLFNLIILWYLQMKFSNSSNQPRAQLAKDGAVVKDHKAMLAVCAAVVIDLRVRPIK